MTCAEKIFDCKSVKLSYRKKRQKRFRKGKNYFLEWLCGKRDNWRWCSSRGSSKVLMVSLTVKNIVKSKWANYENGSFTRFLWIKKCQKQLFVSTWMWYFLKSKTMSRIPRNKFWHLTLLKGIWYLEGLRLFKPVDFGGFFYDASLKFKSWEHLCTAISILAICQSRKSFEQNNASKVVLLS